MCRSLGSAASTSLMVESRATELVNKSVQSQQQQAFGAAQVLSQPPSVRAPAAWLGLALPVQMSSPVVSIHTRGEGQSTLIAEKILKTK